MQITIAGIDRTADVKIDGFNIEQALTSQQDSCSFTIKSGDKPTEGQEIIVEHNGERIFAGVVTNPKEDEKTPTKVFYQCEAVDYGYQFDRRLVVETYENMSASDIVNDILTKYCTDFTGNGVVAAAPTVEYLKLDYIPPSECMKQITEYVGWQWKVDYYKDVQFFEGFNAFAPVEIGPTPDIRKLQHNLDIQGLRNRVYVLGGTFLSDPRLFEYVADGVERQWVLGNEPHSPSVTVSEVAKTCGLENVDDESLYDFMYNQDEKYIRCSEQTTTPVAGATMGFTFKYPMPVITMVEDIASQQAVATIEEGDGIYEHKIMDDSLVTIEAAEAAGNNDLVQHANPTVKGSFETEIPGFAPGQLLTINIPSRGINNQFLIQQVNISAQTDSELTYKITYGGRLKGIPDLLKAIVSSQQQKKTTDVNYQTKFITADLPIGIKIEFTVTPRTTPWYCGDADAICGEIVCLG